MFLSTDYSSSSRNWEGSYFFMIGGYLKWLLPSFLLITWWDTRGGEDKTPPAAIEKISTICTFRGGDAKNIFLVAELRGETFTTFTFLDFFYPLDLWICYCSTIKRLDCPNGWLTKYFPGIYIFNNARITIFTADLFNVINRLLRGLLRRQ